MASVSGSAAAAQPNDAKLFVADLALKECHIPKPSDPIGKDPARRFQYVKLQLEAMKAKGDAKSSEYLQRFAAIEKLLQVAEFSMKGEEFVGNKVADLITNLTVLGPTICAEAVSGGKLNVIADSVRALSLCSQASAQKDKNVDAFLAAIDTQLSLKKDAPILLKTIEAFLNGKTEAIELPKGTADIGKGILELKGLNALLNKKAVTSAQIAGVIHFLATQCPNLRTLNFTRTIVDIKTTVQLKKFANLEVLSFRDCRMLADADLEPIGQLPKLQKLDLNKCTRLTDYAFVHLRNLTELNALSFAGTGINGSGLAILERCTKLEKLYLQSCRNLADPVKNLSKITSLKILDLSLSRGILDDRILPLSALVNLTTLRLASTDITDKGLAIAESMPKLQVLDVDGTKVTAGAMNRLKRKRPQLGKVEEQAEQKEIILKAVEAYLKGTTKTILPTGKDAISKEIYDLEGLCLLLGKESATSDQIATVVAFLVKECPNLYELNFTGTQIDKNAIALLPQFAHLEKLSFEYCSHLTDDDLQPIGMCKELRDLDCCGCSELTDKALGHLSKLQELQRLDVRRTQINGTGLGALKQCPKLEALTLVDCPLITEAVVELATLVSLKELYLRYCDMIREGSFLPLAALVNLERLDLNRTKVTDTDLSILRAMPKLHRLDLEECTKVTDGALGHILQLRNLKTFYANVTKMTDEAKRSVERTLRK